MGNHVHLLVIAGPGGLSRFMQVRLGRYSRWANQRHGSDGGIFETRSHATPVVGDGHLWKATSYVDLNPVKDKFVDRPEDWRWSSYRAHAGLEPAAPLLSLERFYDYFDREAYLRFVEDERRELLRQRDQGKSEGEGV